MIDLFGNEITEYVGSTKFKDMAVTVSKGKAKCCKTCINRDSYEHHNKRYHKCKIVGYSHSKATDIRLKWVCYYWKKHN